MMILLGEHTAGSMRRYYCKSTISMLVCLRAWMAGEILLGLYGIFAFESHFFMQKLR
jgi:hypothetical protein